MKEAKIIYSNYNEETGVTSVTIQTKYGAFTGTAKKHKDDRPSNYVGCYIAELNAWKRYYQFLKASKRETERVLNNLYNRIKKHNKTAKEINIAIVNVQKEIATIKEKLERLQVTKEEYLAQREAFIKRMGSYQGR